MSKKLKSAKNHSTVTTVLSRYINKIRQGDCISEMNKLPSESVDLIFADPPYNLQLSQDLYRTGNNTKVEGCNEEWDKFADFKEYDEFTTNWLAACRRILKPNGTIWVIGAYQNIFRVGTILQDLEYWILNDVIWLKTNPMPNFLGKRLTNAHETLIWASKSQGAKYTFNYHALKSFNEDKQLRSDWTFSICSGGERLKTNSGGTLHPTQKPEALIHRILITSTNSGDVVLDPFSGTGTTCAVAKKLGRNFIGIEREIKYIKSSRARIDSIELGDEKFLQLQQKEPEKERIPFGSLIESEIIKPGSILMDRKGKNKALVRVDGSLEIKGQSGSIHKMGAVVQGLEKCNGWTYWHLEKDGSLIMIDQFREEVRENLQKIEKESDNSRKNLDSKSGELKKEEPSSRKSTLKKKKVIDRNKKGGGAKKRYSKTLLNANEVKEIRKAYENGKSKSSLANRFGTTTATITNAIEGAGAYAQF